MFKQQADFPHLELFKKHFPVTHETIFAWDNIIYTNKPIPEHLVVHEQTHHTQQQKDGLDYWLENYLNNTQYRLTQEIEAYQNQIRSIKDRNLKMKVRIECARNLSSELYGNIITYQEAFNILDGR